MKARGVLVALALAAAFLPISPETVERWYSTGIYPRLQAVITPATNLVPVALLDIASAAVLGFAIAAFVRRARAAGARRAAVALAGGAISGAAVVYLLFVALWGLNYRRVPLEQKLDYDRARVTREAAATLANAAVDSANAGYAAAHARGADDAALARAFAGAQQAIGARRTAVPGVPKHSLLTLYFRRAAIDGMTDPLFLEIILNRDVLAFERPVVLAHEWGHLAGYADESEANFIAWLTCVRSDDAVAQYSGWVAAYQHAAAVLPREMRATLHPLDPGPREDLRAMYARYARSTPVVRNAARGVYDSYLRANRVAEGITSYDLVLRLMLGTRFDDGWAPRMRAAP
ncbi:MAG: DUF3810 family protein [Acidobacteriota bacterium]